MAQVRETIELLTKLLKGNGTSRIKAEVFRLAKFNNDEATTPFWKLLFELLYFLKYGIIDEVTVKASIELTPEEMVVYVKQSMQNKGFYSKEFSNLPNDMSTGSRELLLAFAWLLCKEAIMERFMEHCSSPVDEDSLSVYEFVLNDSSRPSSQNLPTQPLTAAQRVQHLQMLNGKMRGSFKRLHGLQREKNRLDHKVHESTMGVSSSSERNHLSAIEVHMLKNPELLKKVLHLLEKDNERLQNLLTWRDHEESFWKWMESVLDLKNKDTQNRRDHSATQMTYYNIPPACNVKMESARKQLEEAILKYETVIQQLEEIWESKRSAVTDQELDNLLLSINMEISLQRANLSLDQTEAIIQNYKSPELCYVPTHSKKLSNIQASRQQQEGHGDGLQVTTDLKSQIVTLESRLKQMELDLDKRQRKYGHELDVIAGSIPDTICIQPKGCR